MSEVNPASKSGQAVDIVVANITPSPFQSRRIFNQEKLRELGESIKATRLIQPIVTRQIGEDAWELIAGERRWRAHKLIGRDIIPSVVIEATDEEAHAMVLIENIQREDLTITEEARDLVTLLELKDGNKQAVCEKIGKGINYLNDRLLVAEQPREIQNLLDEKKINLTILKVIAEAQDEASKLTMATAAVKLNLSENQLRGRFQRLLKPKENRSSGAAGSNSVKLNQVSKNVIGAFEALDKFDFEMLRDPKKRETLHKQLGILEKAISRAKERLATPITPQLEVVPAEKAAIAG